MKTSMETKLKRLRKSPLRSSNWNKEEVLDKKSSEDLYNRFDNMIKNLGTTITYSVNTNGTYSTPVNIKGYVDTSEDKSVGNLEAVEMFDILVGTKSFYDLSIEPKKNDRLVIDGTKYTIYDVNYYSRDNNKTDLLGTSFIVSLSVVRKTGFTQGSPIG